MSKPVSPLPASRVAVCPVGNNSAPGFRTGIVRRYLLAATGVCFVGIGWVGAFLPGLPTVGPLLIASYCFARSCPWLEQRLIRNRFFAPFLKYIDGEKELTTGARIVAIAMMWTSVLASVAVLGWSGRSPVWLVGLIIVSAGFGTFAILTFRKARPMPTAKGQSAN